MKGFGMILMEKLADMGGMLFQQRKITYATATHRVYENEQLFQVEVFIHSSHKTIRSTNYGKIPFSAVPHFINIIKSSSQPKWVQEKILSDLNEVFSLIDRLNLGYIKAKGRE